MPTDAAASGPAIWPWLLATWALGALIFIGYHLVSHGRFVARVRRMAQSVRLVAAGTVEVIETDAATGPLAFGVWRKYVAFPRDFAERYDPLERDLALAHELGHHARGDLLANWIALGVLALHWFNPIAWRAFRAFRADQEIANDARVLAGLSATARHTYACAIVKSAHGGAVSAACHLHTIHDLKGRLKMLTTNKTSRTRLLGGAAAVAVLTLAGLGLTASGTPAAATMRDKVETAVTTLAISAPTAAELPTPPQASELPEPSAPPTPPVVGAHPITTIRTTADGKSPVRQVMVVRRGKDGTSETRTYPSVEAMQAAMPGVPDVSSQNCADGGDKQLVLNDVKDGKRRMVICTNRITRISTDAAAAANSGLEMKRNALQTAIASLRATRASMAANASMPTEALKGIDEAIKEVTAEMNAAE